MDTVDILRLVSGEDSTEISRGRTVRRNRKLANLMQELPLVLKDVGCTCLAQKLSLYYEEPVEIDEGQCGVNKQQRSTLHLLCQLRPLSEALREAGYYDHALSCAELARSIEPTMDLNLLRAYLFLVLGDNEQACRIYRQAIRKQAHIPRKEIDRLEFLVGSHAAEDDLAGIIAELKACCGAPE